MPSYQDLDESYKRLQGALEGLFHEQAPDLTVSQEDYPLLLLETSSDLVGFAVINDTPEPSFACAYDTFKKLYRKKHSLWKDRNLSFVICRSKARSVSDAFFGSLETDVYFCRKYVISLPPSLNELERELLRLPFLPFPEGRTGVLVQPPSAQTLLQDLNISAVLARQIVVPQEYSATRIVDQLLANLANKEALPLIRYRAESVMGRQVQTVERVRIRRVEIQAFRAYRKRQVFDVDADIIVLYGPNGLGKTSFFDAIDFVCTGRIGRLCRPRIPQKRFVDVTRHLDSSPRDCYVSAHLTKGTKDCSVIRSVVEWGTAVIDDAGYDRASTLQFVTSAHWESKKARIENLERLFRATHLFSQTEPELLIKFAQKSTLSPDLVSRMLALDDYASGLAKAEAMLVNLKKRIDQNYQQVSALKAEADQVESRLKELPQSVKSVPTGRHVSRVATELVKDLRQYCSLKIKEAQPTAETSREWRAIVESVLKDAQKKLRQLFIIESGFAQLDKNRNILRNIISQITQLEELLKSRAEEQERQQEAFHTLANSFDQERTVLTQAKLRQRGFEELARLKEIHRKVIRSLQQWQQEMNRVADEIEKASTRLRPLFATVENLRTEIAKHGEMIREHQQQLQILSEIQNDIPLWKKNRVLKISLQEAVSEAQSAIRSTNTSIDAIKTGMNEKEQELATCTEKYEELSTSQAEFTRLLDELEVYVENGICPTCGADYKTKAVLIQRIHAQKQARPAYVEELAKRCTELRNALKQDTAFLAAATRKQLSKTNELQEKKKRLSDVRESLKLFEGKTAKAGLSMDEDLADAVARKIAQEKLRLKRSQATLTRLESEIADTTKRLKVLEQRRAEQEATRKRVMAAIVPLEKQIADLRSRADELDLSLDIEPQDLAAKIKHFALREAMASKRIGELTPRMEDLNKTLSEVKVQINKAKEKIRALRQDKTRLEEEIRHFMERAATVLDRNAFSLEAITKQSRITAERVDRLHALQRRCSTLELTLDAAQRTAMRAELETRAQSLASKELALVEEAAGMSTVKNWIERVRDALDEQSSRAVADHVEALGPLTTLIQKRLRAVYGFGDVSLSAKGHEIRVMVGWEREQVKPVDYFSESQKQILMLSLFLAGRLTQTWSGFAPILMDDPVTHFDDLNAFGFVELIRGLVSTVPGRRQFFISTCEQRLFDLMLKKFGRLKGGAKFYKFESIGRDGPVVRSLEQ